MGLTANIVNNSGVVKNVLARNVQAPVGSSPFGNTLLPFGNTLGPSPFRYNPSVNRPEDIKVPSNAPTAVTKLVEQFKKAYPNGTPGGMTGDTTGVMVLPNGTTRYSYGGTMPVAGATYYSFGGGISVGTKDYIIPVPKSTVPIPKSTVPVAPALRNVASNAVRNSLFGKGSFGSSNANLNSIRSNIAKANGATEGTAAYKTNLGNAQRYLDAAAKSTGQARTNNMNMARKELQTAHSIMSPKRI